MKPKMENVLPAMLALLILADLAFHGVGELVAAPSMPRGAQSQSPKLDPELARKTREETVRVIKRGEMLWNDRQLGTNGHSCGMCHPGGMATHPETFPKFKAQLGRVVTVQEFLNWCIVAELRGDRQEMGSEALTALEAFQAYANRGQVMEIGVAGS